jgi:hypothetical protein
MGYLPEDINGVWLNVVRRLQSAVASHRDRFCIVTVHILVDPHGDPKLWTSPTCNVIQPTRSVDRVLAMLVGELADLGEEGTAENNTDLAE